MKTESGEPRKSSPKEYTCGKCGFRGNGHEMRVHAVARHAPESGVSSVPERAKSVREVLDTCCMIAATYWLGPHKEFGQKIAEAIRTRFEKEMR